MPPPEEHVVIDTNVFVGAGFSSGSAAAKTVRAVRDGRLRMPWTDATRREVETVMRKIPPLSWSDVEGLFREKDRFDGVPEGGGLGWVEDPDDRKFAALARETGAVLVSNDDHLLGRRDEGDVTVMSSGEFAEGKL